MNRSAPDIRATDRPPGLIDTLQAGFNTLNRNVWLLAIPIALDVMFWLGPQLSIGPLVERWLVTAAAPPGIETGLAHSFEETRRSWLEFVRQDEGLSRFNVLSLLAMPALGVPSFRAGAQPAGPMVALPSISMAMGVGVASVLVGLGLATLFYGMLGQAVREGRALPTAYAPDFGRLYLWVLGLTMLLIAMLLGAGLPFLAVLGATGGRAPAVAGVLAPILLGIALWAYFYLFFTTDALFVSRVPPRVAIEHSIAVVRYNFWSTLGFIALLMVISMGLPVLWVELARGLGTPGVAVAIVGHIYISTGLAAASMTYYKERYERLRSS
jgi:hypothetical protein